MGAGAEGEGYHRRIAPFVPSGRGCVCPIRLSQRLAAPLCPLLRKVPVWRCQVTLIRGVYAVEDDVGGWGFSSVGLVGDGGLTAVVMLWVRSGRRARLLWYL